MRWKVIGIVALLAAVAGTWTGPATGVPPTSTCTQGMTSAVDNPFFPLTPGTTFTYKGESDGQSQTDTVFVTHRTKQILGVDAVVVRDVLTHHGALLEKTFDWYAQDADGNVCYLGENTKEYDKRGNVVSTEGSWEAGVNGAEAGIIMEADPQAPDGYRQEFYAGHAEDQAWILSRGGSLTIAYGRVHKVLRTMEWTPLEPRVVDQKYYAPNVGLVYEVTVAGGDEVVELVRIQWLMASGSVEAWPRSG